MTANNHTAIALSIALVTEHADSLEKAVILGGLAVSHFPLDAIPHGHYYGFANLRKTLLGAIFEVGFGFFLLTWAVGYLVSANISTIFWLWECAIAANLFDFIVASGNKVIKKINHLAHWWDKDEGMTFGKWIWEISETAVVMGVLIAIVFRHMS